MARRATPPAPGSAALFKEGEIARDFTDKDSGLRGLVRRGPLAWCGYVGVPVLHPLHGLEELDFECHYGVTFAEHGDGTFLPASYFWFGWDYAHWGDRQLWPEEVTQLLLEAGLPAPQGKDWSVDEVAEDVLDVLMNLRHAVERDVELARDVLHKVMPG